MSGGAVTAIIIVAVIVVLAILAFVLLRGRSRSRHLQERFGPEYERAVESADSRRAAEQELAQREQRHEELDIRPLEPAIRDEYARKWMRVQEQFVDTPGQAVAEADRLVTVVMAERGYPTEGYEERLSYLSVEHANTLGHYRAARELNTQRDRLQASTEDLRQAMVHYRALFEDLLQAPGDESTRRATEPRVTEPRVTEPRDTEPRNTEPRNTEPRNTEPRDTEPRDTEPRDTLRETAPSGPTPPEAAPRETAPSESIPPETTPRSSAAPDATAPETTRRDVAQDTPAEPDRSERAARRTNP